MDQNYFANKLESLRSGAQKREEITAAFKRNLENLSTYAGELQAAQNQAANSTAAQMGLDPYTDPALHTLVNTGVAAYSGTSRLVGQATTAAYDFFREGVSSNSIPQEVRDARARMLDGKATDGDMEILNAPEGMLKTPKYLNPMQREAFQQGATNLNKIIHWEDTQNNIQMLRESFDRSGLVDNRARIEREQDVRNNHKIDTVGDKILSVGKQVVDHPTAALLDVAENSPQLAAGIAAGPLGTAITVGAYAKDEYDQAIADYRANHNGAMPDQEWMTKNQLLGTALAVPEYAADRLTLGAGKVVGKAIEKAGKIVDGLGESTVKGLLQTVGKSGNNMVTRGAASVALAGAGEYGTEDLQTVLEGRMKDESATPMDRHIAGSAGFMGGAGSHMGVGGFETGRALVDAFKQGKEDAAAAREANAVAAQTYNQAVESQDPSVYLDRNSPNFSPDKALGVLHDLSNREGITPKERSQYQSQAKEVLNTFEDQLASLNTSSDGKYQERVAKLDQVKQEMAALDPADTESLAFYKDYVQALQEEVDAGAPSPEAEVQRQEYVAVLTKKMEAAQSVYESLTNTTVATAVKGMDSAKAVQMANASVDANDTAAVSQAATAIKKVVLLSMASPENVSASDARALAGNTSNSLSDSDRQYLTHYADAAEAVASLKSMEKVHSEVLYGDSASNQLGLTGYQERVGRFLAAGDTRRAESTMAMLTRFLTSQQQKSAALSDALEQFTQTGEAMQIIKKDGQWVVEPLNTPKSVLKKQKNMWVDSASTPLVGHVNTEVEAIAKVQKALESASGLVGKVTAASAQTEAQAAKDKPAMEPVVDDTPKTQDDTALDKYLAAENFEGIETNDQADQFLRSAKERFSELKSLDDLTENQLKAYAVLDGMFGRASTADLASFYTDGRTDDEVRQSLDKPVQEASASSEAQAEQVPETVPAQNPLSKWLKQKTGKDASGSKSALASVKDFMSAWSRGEVSPKDFLKTDPTESQLHTLEFFAKTAGQWSAVIPGFLKKGDPKYADRTPVEHLMVESNGKLDFDENTKTAITMAALTWVQDIYGRGTFNDFKAINAILNRKEDEYVSQQARELLSHVGVRRGLAINALGQKVVQAMGMSVGRDAPKNLMPKLESGLGVYALQLLEQQGLVQVTKISAKEFTTKTGEATTSDQIFVRLSKTKDNQIQFPVMSILEQMKGSQQVLEKLFSVEPGMKAPTFEVVPFRQKTTGNSKQSVPSWLSKILAKKNKEANYLKQEMWHLMEGLDQDLLLQMAGFEVVDDSVQIDRRDSIKAKNEGLERELERLQGFVSNEWTAQGLETPIHFQHDVWSQQRVGIENNLINPQSSKIHRFALFRPSWETEVDPNNAEQLSNFQLRVLEGLGVKTDKQANSKSLEGWNGKISDPVIQAAVQAIIARQQGADLNREQQQAIADGVKKGGEKMHSLDALVALAEYQKAEGKLFTVRLMGEVDGVTNGPMLSHVLMGAAKTVPALFNLINKGGFFQEGAGLQNYNVYRGSNGVMDLYETVASKVIESVQHTVRRSAELESAFNVIWTFTGQLEEANKVNKNGRNIVKKPITALMFGSSIPNVVSGMADEFVDSVLKTIEKVHAGKEDLDTVRTQINAMLQGKHKLEPSISVTELMNHKFTDAQISQIKEYFTTYLGANVQQVMKSEFALLIQRRDAVNQSAQLAYGLYNAAYQSVREKFIEHLVSKGELQTDGAGNLVWDLNKEQEAHLERAVARAHPLVHTLMSLRSKDINSGLSLVGTERGMSSDPLYQQQVKTQSGSVSVSSQATTNTDPGVSMVPKQTHSLDSGISHEAAGKTDALNIHDAHGTGLANFLKVAQNLNLGTWNALLEYSPAMEMYKTLESTIKGIVDLVELSKTDADPVLAAALNEYLRSAMTLKKFKGTVSEFLVSRLEAARSTAYEADKVRLGTLAQLQSLDQYALEGGQYNVTEADRQKAQDALSQLNSEIPADLKAQVLALEAAFNGLAVRKVESNLQAEEATTESVETVFGPTGKPAVSPDADVVAMMTQEFAAGQPVKASLIANRLRGLLKNRPQQGMNAFYWNLSTRVMQALSADVMVQYVTPDMDMSGIALPELASRGWYNPETKTIYILSPDFRASGLTAELLLHEMTHASVQAILDNPVGDQQKMLVQELNNILEAARKHVGTDTTYSEALKNIHELLSWGMFNQKFQRDVLMQVQVESKATKTLKNAWQTFVSGLVNLLFPGKGKDINNQYVTGMTALLSTGTHLFDIAKTAKQSQKGKGQILSMASVIDAFTTEQVFQALNNQGTTAEHVSRLESLMASITNKLHGPFGAIKAKIENQMGGTSLDAWANAQANGTRRMASSIMNIGLPFTEQEGFVAEQVEATVRFALNNKASSNSAVYRELKSLYDQSKVALKGKLPTDTYKYIFYPKISPNGYSDYLSRFVALGLANESFNKTLDFKTQKPEYVFKGKTILQRLDTAWQMVVDWVSSWSTKRRAGEFAGVRLENLVRQLVHQEVIAKEGLKSQNHIQNMLDVVEEKTAGAVTVAKEAVLKMAQSDMVKDSGFMLVRAAGSIATTVAGDRVGKVIEGLTQLRDKLNADRPGTAMALVNYVKGPKQFLEEFVRYAGKIQKDRMTAINETAKAVLNAFNNNGQDLTPEAKAAMSSVILRTGAYKLLDAYGMDKLEQFLGDDKALRQAIDAEVASLSQYPEVHYYIKQSKGLAIYKVEGHTDVRNQNLNAYGISRLRGVKGRFAPAHAEEVQPILERLVTLYALQYSPQASKDQALEVIRSESHKGEDSGVLMTLKMHQFLEQDAKERLFNGNDALMVHGFTSEILNNRTDIQVVRDEEQGAALEEKGYTKAFEIPRDETDSDRRTAYLYVQRGGGLNRYKSGAVSTTGMQAKGTSKHDNFYNPYTAEGVANMQSMNHIASANQQDVSSQFLPDPNYNPSLNRQNENVMLPLFNEQGQIVDYRYTMTERNKDELLQRDNRFEHILGVMAGTTLDKQNSQIHNRQVMQALYEHYRDNHGRNPSSFIKISANSKDAQMREIWHMLPNNTKSDIRDIWGLNEIQVPKEMVDNLFGYRKFSLGEMFDKEYEDRTAVEKIVTKGVYNILFAGAKVKGLSNDDARRLSKQGGIWVRRTEDVWQEIVREAKDTIVIKTATVAIDNIMSNVLMLPMAGVPIRKAISYQLEAFSAVRDYERDAGELAQLRIQQDLGVNTPELNAEVIRLEDAIRRNPVKPLVDAGLKPTIVEDVMVDDDIYSYKSHFTEWVDEKSKAFNPHVVKAARLGYMAHDTFVYRFLNKATQYGDFMARYALYKHLTERKSNPLSVREAMFQASETFVNYDLALPKSLQYLDDAGLLPFIKYAFSTQRVLVRNFKDNPLQVLSVVSMAHAMGGLPTPTDSSFLVRGVLPNFGTGPFEYLTSLGDLGTVQAGAALLK